jgi:hypothetical protein
LRVFREIQEGFDATRTIASAAVGTLDPESGSGYIALATDVSAARRRTSVAGKEHVVALSECHLMNERSLAEMSY